MAFLVGVGWFDMGASRCASSCHQRASERALLCAVAGVSGRRRCNRLQRNVDVPVMNALDVPPDAAAAESVRRRMFTRRGVYGARGETAKMPRERGAVSGTPSALCDVTRVGDIPGMDIPARYFRFLRSGDARPLEPVLEHNRLDLISLAAVCAHAVQLVDEGSARCRDAAEALALGRVYERAGSIDRAIAAYRRAEADPSAHVDVVLEAIYRLGLRLRRDRRFAEAADCWRRLLDVKPGRVGRRSELLVPLRQYAVEALAVHHEHRERDYEGAKELTLRLLDESDEGNVRLKGNFRLKADATRRLNRLEKKIARKNDSHLFA